MFMLVITLPIVSQCIPVLQYSSQVCGTANGLSTQVRTSTLK